MRTRPWCLCSTGEIYNYKQLRKELQGKGACLRHGYGLRGAGSRLRGMAGGPAEPSAGNVRLCHLEPTDESLFIARDFFGIKPMHYTQVGGHFLYASEIKSILKFPALKRNSTTAPWITIFLSSMPFRLRPSLRGFTAYCPATTCGTVTARWRPPGIGKHGSTQMKA